MRYFVTRLLAIIAASSLSPFFAESTVAAAERLVAERLTAERFALADNREAVVASLVPGTDEHFYYRTLLWQQQGKLAEVDALLPRWKELHPESSRRDRVVVRQAALWFERDPAIGARQMAEIGGLEFRAADEASSPATERTAATADKAELPSILSPSEFAWDKLINLGDDNGTFTDWTEAGLTRRIAEITDPAQRRTALKLINWPTFPQALELIMADLAEPGGDFGSLPVHAHLSVAQLEACRVARSALVEDDDFVVTYIRALRRRHDDAAWARDPALRLAWVEELSRFAGHLPRTAQTLKSHLALHRLDLELRLGQPSRATLQAVLSNPRPTSAQQQQNNGKSNGPDNISSSIIEATGLGDIHQTTRLVKDALLAWFVSAPDINDFAGLVDDDWLRRIFVEAKLLYGVGEASTWLTRADDAQLGLELKNRVELDFARSAEEHFAGDEAVELPLVLKNIPELRVRLFALDAVNRYRFTGAEPTTSMDLAGVLPTHERVVHYEHVPIQRHHERLLLPECAGPGMWLVELIGGGHVARALIRKGSVRFFSEDRPDGEHLIVMDEANRHVHGARVWEGDQQFTAGPDHSVRLPYVAEPRSRLLVLAGAGRAAMVTYQRKQEKWTLSDGALLEREQLIAGGRATALLRPRLRLNGVEQPLNLASALRVVITTTTHAGIRQVTTSQPDVSAGEWLVTFPVPESLAHVAVALHATVRNQARGEDDHLVSNTDTHVNENHLNDRVVELHLEYDAHGWSLAALGRAGEAVAGEVLSIGLQHKFVRRLPRFNLKTAADGRVRLGHLAEVEAVLWYPPPVLAKRGDVSGGYQRRWELRTFQHVPTSMTIASDQELRLPATWFESGREAAAAPRDWWLLRGDDLAVGDDVSDLAKIDSVAGIPVLVAPRLPAGNYRLITPIGHCDVRVLGGARHQGVVLTTRVIEQLDTPTPLGIRGTEIADGVRLQVANATANTRVHVYGLRFYPSFERRFPQRNSGLQRWLQSDLPSHYQQGFPLDDELRYILDRAHAPKLPGVMLERPGLLLNPWHDASVMAGNEGAHNDGMFGSRNGGGKRRAVSKGGSAYMSEKNNDGWSQLDFLPHPGVVLANVKPDANGAIQLTKQQLGDARVLAVIACDVGQQATTVVPRTAAPPLATRERRLIAGLPVNEHLVTHRQGRAVAAGTQVMVAPASGVQGGEVKSYAQSRTCGTVAELFRLLSALAPDTDLTSFEPLTRWSALTDNERRAWYSDNACHEVHLFLWRKDRTFFDAVVRPYLANKLQKTFIDQWLLHHDLTPWLAADRHARLNVVERILLARRLTGDARTQELAHIAELFRDLPDATAELGARIATALAMSLDATLGDVGEVKKRAEPVSETPLEKNEANQAVINAPPQEEGIINNVERVIQNDTDMVSQAYRDTPQTQGLIEQNWYNVPLAEQNEHLFEPSLFWREFSQGDAASNFLSASCLLATKSRNDILLALALTDLPLTAAPPIMTTLADGSQHMTAQAALLWFTQDVTTAALVASEQLIHQRLYRLDQLPESSPTAKPVTGQLRAKIAYLARSVVLNPTPQPVTVAVLAQIPTGSIPLHASETTVAEEYTVQPYGSVVCDQAFYFPQAGQFTQFSTHVRSATGVIAAISDRHITVTEQQDRSERGGWSDDPQAIVRRLEQAPTNELQLSDLLWRLSDKAFWSRCVTTLEGRRLFDERVWSYSVLHRDAERMAVWFRARSDLVERMGRTFTSKWLSLDPLSDGGVTHVDFAPLINARTHRRSDDPAMNHVAAKWGELIARLALENPLTPRDHVELAYALMLQDRHSEAAAHFARIERTKITAQVQYDYLGAYLALARGDLIAAADFAARGKDHPVPRWRLRFAEVAAQLDEISGRTPVRENTSDVQKNLARQITQAPSFQARLTDAGDMALITSNLATCTVRWYRLDLEPLFSRSPFSTAEISTTANSATAANGAGATHVSFINPSQEKEIHPAADGTALVPLPPELRHQPLMIEVLAAGQRQSFTRFADRLDVQLFPASGQLLIRQSGTAQPLPATYVKVYVENRDGLVVFYKDGYTDLRGRFDYASLGTGAVNNAKRFALFISHDQAGATVREVSPP
jgi:hypothetical protein